jgi:hypothetical protein
MLGSDALKDVKLNRLILFNKDNFEELKQGLNLVTFDGSNGGNGLNSLGLGS